MTVMAGLLYWHRWNMALVLRVGVSGGALAGAPSPILGSARIGDQTARGARQFGRDVPRTALPCSALGRRVDLDAALPFWQAMAAGQLPFVIEDGGGGDTLTRVVCGFLGCDVHAADPVLGTLPPVLAVSADGLSPLLDHAVAQARAPQPGSRSVLLRLSEALFVEGVRRGLDHVDSPWLAALHDPAVGRALRALHADPARPWTVHHLARAAGLSRSRLAECFTARLGEPPMRYLARWRVQLAAARLADGQDKVATIAHEVGYRSEAAFSRAFKRHTGLSPAAFRQQGGHVGG